MKTAIAAQGKWTGVLKQLGMPDNYLRNIHGPCPLCGGNDRFRFDDKEGNGTYYCNSCGAGDGMKLALLWTGREFKELAGEIDAMVGNMKASIRQAPKTDPMVRINRIWTESQPLTEDDPASRYLRARMLPKCSVLRCHPSLAYYEEGKVIGNFPAMVAPVLSRSGKISTLHITYLREDGIKASVRSVKKILPPAIDTAGSAIRLTKIYERIGIAEGIETALAAMKLYRVPVWSACNAVMLERFTPPEGVKEVIIFSDNDANFRGQAAAYKLANRLMEREGIIATVEVPKEIGDYADLDPQTLKPVESVRKRA
jgi:putative DNA primase/helicase